MIFEQTCLQDLVCQVLGIVEHLSVETQSFLDAADTYSRAKSGESLPKLLQVGDSTFCVLREGLDILERNNGNTLQMFEILFEDNETSDFVCC